MDCKYTDIACHWDGAKETLKGWGAEFLQWLLDILITVLSYIPVPDWMENVGSMNLPSGVLWFASAFELQAGAAIMVSAWTLRFIIRRIPVVG
ncbi:hypothetical protein [Kineobactrum salinum]|nr:hypothetical protein [Kineobactrum salinum]QIB64050.1 hypothetical protein G3T16_00015 [Kineobactrum salinum]QIB64056.1 hypothetical protein G3T16_00050 [Kineobactrum salinum]